jgi:hypothetical protein
VTLALEEQELADATLRLATSPGRRRTRRQHRAVRVMHAVLADRAEQRLGECPVAAAAADEQVRIGRSLQQNVGPARTNQRPNRDLSHGRGRPSALPDRDDGGNSGLDSSFTSGRDWLRPEQEKG